MSNHFGMKKIVVLLLGTFPVISFSQNVGIGTSTPAARLQINHRSSSAPGLALIDSATNFGGTLEFRNNNNTRRMLMQGFAASNFNNGQYLDIRSDSVYAATFKGNGYVGIRNTDPSYPLDIIGDINTSGSLRVNGNAGTDGQVLQSNGNGTMSWVDMYEFKNYETFRTPGSSTWTVPAGVTKILIEAWGGGGGGSGYGGGGGGGYIAAYFTVAPGSSIAFTVGNKGSGGNDGSTVATSGQISTATVGTVTITANGGRGSEIYDVVPPVGVFGASGGGYGVTPSTFRNYIGQAGEDGEPNKLEYHQTATSVFIEVTKGGKGGDAGNAPNSGAKGAYVIYNSSALSLIRYVATGTSTKSTGGGGGGNYTSAFYFGSGGADGKIIIHY
jgi:hypothetical protein